MPESAHTSQPAQPVTADKFSRTLGDRRGSGEAGVAPSAPSALTRARAVTEALIRLDAGRSDAVTVTPERDVSELAYAHGLTYRCIGTRSFAQGALLLYELRDAGEQDWSALLAWRGSGWQLYAQDARYPSGPPPG